MLDSLSVDPLHARSDPRRGFQCAQRTGRGFGGRRPDRRDGHSREPEVRGACEMLGLDPLYVANEGKLIAVVPPEDAAGLLDAMREHPLGRNCRADRRR